MGFLDDLFAKQPTGTTSRGHGSSIFSNDVDATLSHYREGDQRLDPITGESGTTRSLARKALEEGRDPGYLKY